MAFFFFLVMTSGPFRVGGATRKGILLLSWDVRLAKDGI